MEFGIQEINEVMIQEWISRGEIKDLDFKECFNFSTKETKASFVKDFLAMANTKGGGRIVVGFKEKDQSFECVGIDSEGLGQYEITKISDIIKEYADPMIRFDSKVVSYQDKKIIVIYIHEFDREPVLCKKDCGNELQQGKIYHRTLGASSKPIDNSSDLRKLINLAIEKSKEEMIQSLHRIISGTSENKEILIDEYMSSFDKLFKQKIPDEKPFFEIHFLPESKISFDLPKLEAHIKDSVYQTSRIEHPLFVGYEKNIFPLDSGKGLTIELVGNRANEIFYFHENGYVGYRSLFLEDEIIIKKINMIYLIWRFTEHIYFLNNYVKNIEGGIFGSFALHLQINGIGGWELKDDPRIHRRNDFICNNKIIQKDLVFDCEQLLKDPDSVICKVIESIFYFFDFKNIHHIPNLVERAKEQNQ